MKLLIWGHWSHTGFGIVTEALSTRFLAMGLDVRVLALNLRGEHVKGPMAGRVYPLDFIEAKFDKPWRLAVDGTLWQALDDQDDWKPDAILVVADVSGLRGYVHDDFAAWSGLPVYHYCPIEGDQLPPLWRGVWAHVRPVTMSHYGRRLVSEFLEQPVPMVYHGVDTETFYPVSPGKPIRALGNTLRTADDCKAMFGVPEGFRVLFRADRNVIRKNYDALLRAFVPIAQARPNTWLVLHCQAIDRDGQDLRQEITKLPEDVRELVKFTNAHDTYRGLPAEGLNALYNAADVYVSTTGGEGFGLTLAESLAAGTPVVSNGYAAEVEVIGDGGIIIPPLTDKYGELITTFNPVFGMAWSVPDVRAFAEPIIGLLDHPKRAEALGAAGRIHVKRSFSWDVAAAQFLDIFSEPLEAAA